jgi:RNA polymerase sigma-70 factor (ECF subfamily)
MEHEELWSAVLSGMHKRHAGWITRYCAARAKSAAQGEDLAAEVFARAWKKRGSFGPPYRAAAWLRGIAKRVCLSHARRQAVERRCLQEWAREGGGPRPPEEPPEVCGRRELIERAMSGSAPGRRRVLKLRYLKGLQYGEIARELGTNDEAARARVKRAREVARRMLRVGA